MQVINPATGQVIKEYQTHSTEEVQKKIQLAQEAFQKWRKLSFSERAKPMVRLSKLLEEQVEPLARLITEEMGKPIKEARSEVLKSAAACSYYASHAEELLKPETRNLEKEKALITFEPLGIILGIMPWNYPIWQVLRFAAPTLMAGNAILLKHAPNVSGCALALEKLINQAGFPKDVLQALLIPVEMVPSLIEDPRVHGISLTGSERAGISVGTIAGKALKKCVLELGGSDPFLVFEDADLNACVKAAISGRLGNCGQSCIAAKRFVVSKKLEGQFCEQITQEIKKMKQGDPFHEDTELGPLAREDLLQNLDRQVQESVAQGAKLLLGGKRLDRPGCFYEPTILLGVKKGMPAYQEETFGPVFAILTASSVEEAIQLANDTAYGLGASIWTQSQKLADEVAKRLEAGIICINAKTSSYIPLPFGGIKRSGYGRELSEYGIKEFVNIKSIVRQQI